MKGFRVNAAIPKEKSTQTIILELDVDSDTIITLRQEKNFVSKYCEDQGDKNLLRAFMHKQVERMIQEV